MEQAIRRLCFLGLKGAPRLSLWGLLALVVVAVVALACQGGGAAPLTTNEASPTSQNVPLTTPTLTPQPTETPTPEDPKPSPDAGSPSKAWATPTPQPQRDAAPYTLEIEAIGVYAEVVPVGRAPDGTMATPQNPYAVGWYAAGPRPGSPQNVLLAGHLDFVDQAGRARPGVFWRLRELRPGNPIYLVEDGQRYRYVVQESIKLRYDDPEAINLLAPERGAVVTIITCEGPEFDAVARNYLWRRVVVATLQPE